MRRRSVLGRWGEFSLLVIATVTTSESKGQGADRLDAFYVASADLVLGNVADVAADRAARIYIADAKQGRIHILDRTLRQSGVVGQLGSKPGEFTDLVAVRVIDGDRFMAVERYLRRIYFYRWKAGAPELEKVANLPFEPSDACVTGRGSVLVVGHYKGLRVHQLGADGSIIASLAPLDPSVDAKIARRTARGWITCSASGSFILTSALAPVVEFFDGDAASPYLKELLSPVRPLLIEVTENPAGMRMSSGPLGFHAPGRATQLGTFVLVGARIVARTDGGSADSVQQFIYDMASRKWTDRRGSIGRVFPISGDSALRVAEARGVELQVVSLRQLGLSMAVVR
jgi:hypothetical protein